MLFKLLGTNKDVSIQFYGSGWCGYVESVFDILRFMRLCRCECTALLFIIIIIYITIL